MVIETINIDINISINTNHIHNALPSCAFYREYERYAFHHQSIELPCDHCRAF